MDEKRFTQTDVDRILRGRLARFRGRQRPVERPTPDYKALYEEVKAEVDRLESEIEEAKRNGGKD
ncbi:hypothetical protein CKW00_06975 [Salimicrobium humidisoli]|uniref:Fur-regulated basic protein B n=1 Tax=Salimicrobium humidisoli TaxID=2029857 RepID=A0ABX4HRA5_9BACI|nr:hypothetical protein CKW00_06975 [Salimicrobium humidisoli]